MKNFLFALFFIYISFTAVSQNQSVQIVTTGNICGDVLEVKILNNTNEVSYFKLQAFYLPIALSGQALVIPEGTSVLIGASSSKSIFLKGFSVFCDRKMPEKGLEFSLNDITQFTITKKIDFTDSASLYGNYVPKKFSGSKLISLDFIPQLPGTSQLLGYKIDFHNHPQVASRFTIGQLNLIESAFNKAFYAGKVITHFNSDPVIEKAIVQQMALWICTSGMQGKALRKKHLIKITKQLYLSVTGSLPEKKFNDNADTYIRLLDKIGTDALIYIKPENLDRRVKGIPESPGINATSDFIRTPTLSKIRYEQYQIRNQAMLGPRNDCLPCTLDSSLFPSVRNCLYVLQNTAHKNKIIEARKEIDSVYLPPFFGQPLSYMDGFKNFDPQKWLTSKDMPIADLTQLLIENANFYLNNLIEKSDVAELKQYHTFILEYRSQYMNLFRWCADLYQIKQQSYSFDCCEWNKLADNQYIQLSKAIEDFLIKYNHLFSINYKYKSTYDTQFFNYLLINGTVAYTQAALLNLYKLFTDEKQYICLPGYFPSVRLNALNQINAVLGTNLSETGRLEYYRLFIDIDETHSFEFRFGECNCGKKRESLLPFPSLQTGKSIATSEGFKPLDLSAKYELSAFAGRTYFSPQGASYFDGQGLLAFSKIDKIIDSFFREKYSEKFYFTAPDSFSFDYFSVYGASAGLDLNKNLQIRASGQSMTGLVTAKAGFNYFPNPLDSNSLTKITVGTYNKISAWKAGVGIRYYWGNYLRPYAGASVSFLSMKNTIAKSYVESVEIQMLKVANTSTFTASLEAGVRYYFNQDFYVEIGANAVKRLRDYPDINGLGLDKNIYLGAGARF